MWPSTIKSSATLFFGGQLPARAFEAEGRGRGDEASDSSVVTDVGADEMGCILVRKVIDSQDWCDLIVWNCQPGPEGCLVVERKTGEGRAVMDSEYVTNNQEERTIQQCNESLLLLNYPGIFGLCHSVIFINALCKPCHHHASFGLVAEATLQTQTPAHPHPIV
jgi:hypothetical protein